MKTTTTKLTQGKNRVTFVLNEKTAAMFNSKGESVAMSREAAEQRIAILRGAGWK